MFNISWKENFSHRQESLLSYLPSCHHALRSEFGICPPLPTLTNTLTFGHPSLPTTTALGRRHNVLFDDSSSSG